MSGLERHNMQRDPAIDSWPHGSLMAINCGRFHPETGLQPNFSYQIYIGLLWFIHVYSIYRYNQGEYCRLARDHICIYLSHLIKYRGFRQIFLSFKSWRYSRSNGRGNPKFMSRPTCPHNVYGSYRIYGCKLLVEHIILYTVVHATQLWHISPVAIRYGSGKPSIYGRFSNNGMLSLPCLIASVYAHCFMGLGSQ